MAQRPHVPKFGNWESEDVPYTVYFDKARKGKSGGKIINPNDPQENPDLFSDDTPIRAPSFRTVAEPEVAVGPGAVRQKHERRSSREDGDLRRATTDSPHQRYGDLGINSGENSRRTGRQNGGYDRSVERSPLHPQYQARAGKGNGVSSPSWERRDSSENSHGSRLRSAAREDETTDDGAPVPRFGDWDEKNPASADGYTVIFNELRKKKQSGIAKVPVMPNESPYSNGQKQYNNDNSMGCCFPWCKK